MIALFSCYQLFPGRRAGEIDDMFVFSFYFVFSQALLAYFLFLSSISVKIFQFLLGLALITHRCGIIWKLCVDSGIFVPF